MATVRRVHVVTDSGRWPRGRAGARQMAADLWTALKVTAVVVATIAVAPLDLAAAALGLPPASWTARRIASQVRAAWWRRRHGTLPPPVIPPAEPEVLTGVIYTPTASASEEEFRG